MKLIEVTFRVYDQDHKCKELVETRVLNLDALRQHKIPFPGRVAIYADKFWESIVLMGVFDEEKSK